MSSLIAQSAHRPSHLRKDPFMHPHIAIALQIAREHQERERGLTARNRARAARSRPLQHRLGQGLIRLGRRLAPEMSHEPAWSR